MEEQNPHDRQPKQGRVEAYQNQKPQSTPLDLDLHHDDPSDSPPDSTSISSDISDSHISSPHELDPPTSAKVGHTGAVIGINRDVEDQKLSERRRRLRPDLSILQRPKTESSINRSLLGFRVFGFVLCLVSFSLMAANKNQGWALDSFYNYKEFRYCWAVSVIGFLYSGFQVCDLGYQLASGKRRIRHKLRFYFDFAADQVLAYLLASASSSGFVRVDEWQLNWGSDKFPNMAKASVALSFLAFLAFTVSSLVSGYVLCSLRSTL